MQRSSPAELIEQLVQVVELGRWPDAIEPVIQDAAGGVVMLVEQATGSTHRLERLLDLDQRCAM